MLSLKLFFLIIFQLSFIFCVEQELKIHKNEMSEKMTIHVIAQALTLLETETNLNIIAKKLKNDMNEKFGKDWICYTGINANISGLNFNPEENSFIWFSFKEKHFIVFREKIETSTQTTKPETTTKLNIPELNSDLCQSQGFFRNPYNCSLSYWCIQIEGRYELHDLRDQPCPRGLVFDEKKQECAKPESTEPCHNKHI
jgi:hypothetical protein